MRYKQGIGESVIAQAAVWRRNRSLYPGWLIAPYKTREKIWRNTREWFDVAVDAVEILPHAHSMLVWRELSWRFGVCLQVVPDRAIDLIGDVVDGVEELILDETKSVERVFPSDGELMPTDEEALEYWLECKLVQLTGYRIRPDIDACEGVANSVLALEALSQDQRSCIVYQLCLSALSELDRDRVLTIMERWPKDPEDPYWLVRKGAVLLELGDREAAVSTAKDALERIRRRRQATKIDYWKLSREGWCLRFLYQVDSSERLFGQGGTPSKGLDEQSERRQLDRELEIARCSPDTELRLMGDRINKRPPPEIPPFSTYRVLNAPDFDSGWTGQSIRMGAVEPISALASAINILVASEMTGVQPRVGNVVFFQDAFKGALQWVRDELPGLWFAFALRFGGIGIGKDEEASGGEKHDAIRRTTLAKLPIRHTRRLFSAGLQELERIADAETSEKKEFSLSDLWTAVKFHDVVTRLSLRLDDDERDKIVSITLNWVRTRRFSAHLHEEKIIRYFVARVVPYLNVKQLRTWIVPFISDLPLWSDNDRTPARWPEALSYIPKARGTQLKRENIDGIELAVDDLIEHVANTDIRMRTAAALRLLFLSDWGLLSEGQLSSFQALLWETLDVRGLPVVDNDSLHLVVHFDWPVDLSERPIEGLRAWILSESVKNRFKPAKGETDNGLARYSISWPDDDTFLNNLVLLAQHLHDRRDDFGLLFDVECKGHILKSILDWWDGERDLFHRESSVYRHFGERTFYRVNVALRVIFDCLFDGHVLEEESKEKIVAFANDARTLERWLPFVYPVLAYLQPECQRKWWGELRMGLYNDDPSVAYDTLTACKQWQRAANRLGVMGMPNEVLWSLLTSIGTVMGPVSHYGYQIIRELLLSGSLNDAMVSSNQLTDATEIAAFRLAYGDEKQKRVFQEEGDNELIVHLRKGLALLLVAYREKDIPIGPIAEEWLERAKADRFVDVRQAVSGG